jgi:hypothetical protein
MKGTCQRASLAEARPVATASPSRRAVRASEKLTSLPVLIPQLQPYRAQAGPERKRRHAMEERVVVVGALPGCSSEM